MALVAAIGVIAYHTEVRAELLAKPHSFVKNGEFSSAGGAGQSDHLTGRR